MTTCSFLCIASDCCPDVHLKSSVRSKPDALSNALRRINELRVTYSSVQVHSAFIFTLGTETGSDAYLFSQKHLETKTQNICREVCQKWAGRQTYTKVDCPFGILFSVTESGILSEPDRFLAASDSIQCVWNLFLE